MSHWAVNDGKMKICERKDVHLWTTHIRSYKTTLRKSWGKMTFSRTNKQIRTSLKHTDEEVEPAIRSFLAKNPDIANCAFSLLKLKTKLEKFTTLNRETTN